MTARKSDQDAEAKDETSVTGRRPACERRVSSLVAVRVARHVPGLSRIRPERVRFGAVVHSHVYQHFGTRVLACASGGDSVTCSKNFHPYLLQFPFVTDIMAQIFVKSKKNNKKKYRKK